MEVTKDAPFTFEQITDVRVIVQANGKNYAINPKAGQNKALSKLTRISLFRVLLEDHDIITPALEDIKADNWISVKESLPEIDKEVQIGFKDKYEFKALYKGNGQFINEKTGSPFFSVIKWRPL